jgi:transcriptional activator SPT7
MILHTLYHSGTQEVSQLELYIRDDVERHGSKLAELAKKMQAAYTETVGSSLLSPRFCETA